MAELVILSEREPTFEEWFASVDDVTAGRVLDLVGGGWHAVDADDQAVVTWWSSVRLENPRTANALVDPDVHSGQVWTDVLVPLDGDRGWTIAHRLAERVGGTVVRRL